MTWISVSRPTWFMTCTVLLSSFRIEAKRVRLSGVCLLYLTQLHDCVCIFVYFDNVVDRPQQLTEVHNRDIQVIILIIKKRQSSTGKRRCGMKIHRHENTSG